MRSHNPWQLSRHLSAPLPLPQMSTATYGSGCCTTRSWVQASRHGWRACAIAGCSSGGFPYPRAQRSEPAGRPAGKFYIFDTGSEPPMRGVLEDMIASGLVEYSFLTNTTKEIKLEPPQPGRSFNWQVRLSRGCGTLRGGALPARRARRCAGRRSCPDLPCLRARPRPAAPHLQPVLAAVRQATPLDGCAVASLCCSSGPAWIPRAPCSASRAVQLALRLQAPAPLVRHSMRPTPCRCNAPMHSSSRLHRC